MTPAAIPNSWMTHTVTIKRRTRAFVSGTKQPTVSEANVTTGLKVRIEPMTGQAAQTILGRIPEATHRLFTNSADLKQGDLVVDEAAGGRTYVVREMNAMPAFAKNHHLEAVLEVKNDA